MNSTNNPPIILPTSPPARRRQHAIQPPNLLTTTLGNARYANQAIGNIQHTPLTSTALSTPFSAHPQSAYPNSPADAMRGASFRHTPVHPTAYNPQQWGPVSSTSPQPPNQFPQTYRTQHAYAPRQVGPDEPVASPPPPYSPRRTPGSQESPRLASDTISPSDTTSPDTDASRYNTPLTSANTLSPDFLLRQATGRNISSQNPSSANASPNLNSSPVFPPPPPTSGSRLRSTSKEHAGRILSSLTSRRGMTTASPSTSIDALRINTGRILSQEPEAGLVSPTVRPPGSRRAASTGNISLARDGSRSASQSPAVWEPGMPIPPPPPGPPPAAARTQSLSRPSESPSTDRGPLLPVRTRRPPGQGTSLETVPPTPADWREDSVTPESRTRERSTGPVPLHIDTGSILRKRRSGYEDPMTATGATPIQRYRDSSAGGLARTPAVRNRSAMGLRERRSESKHGRERAGDISAVDAEGVVAPWDDEFVEVKPSNLNLASNARMSSNRRDTATRQTPGSGRALRSLDETIRSAGPRASSGKAVSFDAPTSGRGQLKTEDFTEDSTPTPPASARENDFQSNNYQASARNPLRISQKLSLMMPVGPDQRPISHILHTPNIDSSLPVPLMPSSTSAKQRPVSDLLGPESPRAFAERAMERHRKFAEREAAAADDSARLELFVQFMVAESKIRREQYAQVFEAEEIDTGELSKDLFKAEQLGEHDPKTRDEHLPEASSRRTSSSSAIIDSSSQDGESFMSRQYESPSSATSNSSAPRPTSGVMKDFIPSLSPIASMSIVTGQDDEQNSRGRASSRWWEDASQGGSAVNDGFNVLGRSRRESKYMGVPKEAAFFESRESTSSNLQWPPGESSQPAARGPSEYPPEKAGWHQQDAIVEPPPPPPPVATPSSAPPFTPNARALDISRLVTLPPPYPRHHPAVNNSHPELADTRAVIRQIQDREEPETIRSRFQTELLDKRKRADSWCQHQRSLHQQDVQFRIEHGDIDQSDYDQLEADLQSKIEKSERDLAQADFDLFQDVAVSPLHALFAERISLANSSLDQLSSHLFSTAQHHSPTLPQEEGDEQPELLEKLTQLKWLFEARETLHRQTYDLLSERNSKYRAIVLLPYRQQNNQDKYADAENFFAQDALDRRRTYETSVSERANAFLSVIERNVARGVEVQLDAFWEIAPSLRDILHKVPSDLSSSNVKGRSFDIRIPADEFVENPAYHDHPLQYLYSLLGHAEKSTYQFIESQTNLLCLLHEIRSCALSARCKVEANATEGNEEDVERHLVREETRLTEDLKEKVGVLEGQWGDALGDEMKEVRERVRERLLEEGGWDDEEDV